MLSFQEPNKADPGLILAYANGPDFDRHTPVYLHEDPNKTSIHFAASARTCDLLREKYEGEIVSKRNGRTIADGPAVAVPKPGRALQLYGPNKYSLAAETHPRQVKTILLCGAPGAGKSFWIGSYMDNFRRLYPDSKIIVFSRKKKEDEPEFRQDYQQIDVESRDFIENPICVDDCKGFAGIGVLAVFDDTSTFGKQTLAAIHASMNDLIKVGRSSNVHVIMSNHNINDGARTTQMHNNATTTVLFPNSHREKVETYFASRLKLKQAAVDFIMDQPTRWIAVSHTTPQYILTENQLFMLNALTDHLKKSK